MADDNNQISVGDAKAVLGGDSNEEPTVTTISLEDAKAILEKSE